jgi:hypothetical protein
LDDDELVRLKNGLHISRKSRFLLVGITMSSSSFSNSIRVRGDQERGGVAAVHVCAFRE